MATVGVCELEHHGTCGRRKETDGRAPLSRPSLLPLLPMPINHRWKFPVPTVSLAKVAVALGSLQTATLLLLVTGIS